VLFILCSQTKTKSKFVWLPSGYHLFSDCPAYAIMWQLEKVDRKDFLIMNWRFWLVFLIRIHSPVLRKWKKCLSALVWIRSLCKDGFTIVITAAKPRCLTKRTVLIATVGTTAPVCWWNNSIFQNNVLQMMCTNMISTLSEGALWFNSSCQIMLSIKTSTCRVTTVFVIICLCRYDDINVSTGSHYAHRNKVDDKCQG